MSSLLLALALASPSFNGVLSLDGGTSVHTEEPGPESVGVRAGGRLGFAVRWARFEYVCEVVGGWIRFPEDESGLSASGFELGSGVRLGFEVFDLRPSIFGHLGVEGLFMTRVEQRDDQVGRRTLTTTRDDAGLGADVGVALTYTGLPRVGVGVHGMWQTTLEIDNRRERLTAGLHIELDRSEEEAPGRRRCVGAPERSEAAKPST